MRGAGGSRIALERPAWALVSGSLLCSQLLPPRNSTLRGEEVALTSPESGSKGGCGCAERVRQPSCLEKARLGLGFGVPPSPTHGPPPGTPLWEARSFTLAAPEVEPREVREGVMSEEARMPSGGRHRPSPPKVSCAHNYGPSDPTSGSRELDSCPPGVRGRDPSYGAHPARV